MGKHREAIDVFEEAGSLGTDDWEIYHNKGLCHMYLKEYVEAVEDFQLANEIEKHDVTYIQLGKVYTLQEMYPQVCHHIRAMIN